MDIVGGRRSFVFNVNEIRFIKLPPILQPHQKVIGGRLPRKEKERERKEREGRKERKKREREKEREKKKNPEKQLIALVSEFNVEGRSNTCSIGRVGRPPRYRVPPEGDLRWCFAAESSCFDHVLGIIVAFWHWFRFYCFRLRLALGLLVCGGFVFVFCDSCVSYIDHSFKLTTF